MKKILIYFWVLSMLLQITTIDVKAESEELYYSSSEVMEETNVKSAYEMLKIFNGLGVVKCSTKYIKAKTPGSKYKSYYYRVTEKKYNTMKKLKKRLRKYFTSSYTNKLLKKKMFIQKKGKLYFAAGERGSDVSYEKTNYAIVNRTANKRTIKAVSYYWKNYDQYPKKYTTKTEYYVQKKVGGKWVFNEITLPY